MGESIGQSRHAGWRAPTQCNELVEVQQYASGKSSPVLHCEAMTVV